MNKNELDVNAAINFGNLLMSAYSVLPSNLANRAGQMIDNAYDVFSFEHKIVSSIYGHDLATQINPPRQDDWVSFGHITQDKNGHVVVTIRGTSGVWEWMHDAAFLALPCGITTAAGFTEDGFTAVYGSLTDTNQKGSVPLRQSLDELVFEHPVTSLSVCGHSLGAALATLLGFDIAANSTKFDDVNVYTFASPRVGDMIFARRYNELVKRNWRIHNRCDIVPNLPPIAPIIYEHVGGGFELIPNDVVLEVRCEHAMETYLHLLGLYPEASIKRQLSEKCTYVHAT